MSQRINKRDEEIPTNKATIISTRRHLFNDNIILMDDKKTKENHFSLKIDHIDKGRKYTSKAKEG